MFSIGPAFYGGTPTPPVPEGTPFDSGLTANFSGLEICKVSDTEALVTYNDASDHQKAVVVTVSGYAASFGTPATVQNSDTGLSFNVVRLNAATDEFVIFGRTFSATHWARVVTAAGGVVATPNPLATRAQATSQGWGVVVNPTQLGLVFTPTSGQISGIGLTVASGVITWGSSPTAMTITGSANLRVPSMPPQTNGAGASLWFDMYDGVTYTNLNVSDFAFTAGACSITTPWMPPVAADRIVLNLSYERGGLVQTGLATSTMAFLYVPFGRTDVCSVKGTFNGSTGTYNHDSTTPYPVPLTPYTPPANNRLEGQPQPRATYGGYTVAYVESGVGKLYSCSVSGEVQMSDDIITIVASGCSKVRHVHLTPTKTLVVWRTTTSGLFAAVFDATS